MTGERKVSQSQPTCLCVAEGRPGRQMGCYYLATPDGTRRVDTGEVVCAICDGTTISPRARTEAAARGEAQ